MKISLNWLKYYIDLSDISAEQIAETLPMLGLEVESVETLGLKKLDNVIVGEILSRVQHPNADKLGVCMVKVSTNSDPIQIVCGASNYKVGDRVPVAIAGAKLPTPEGGIFEIKKSKLRDVESNGMMCSAKELGMGQDHSGLLILENRPEIGTPINEVFTDSDTVFEIELTANRGDCLSHIGIARELAAKFGKTLKLPELKTSAKYSETSESALLSKVELNTPNCPLYTAVCIKGVKIAPSPDWLKKCVEAVGLRSISNVVDVTNFVMMEYGQPLHAFDAKKIRGSKIIVRQALDAEKIVTLDNKTHTLNTDNMLICDGEGAVALAGIMGALNSEVEDSTTDIVLESAYFNPANVRSSSRKLIINTDSSYRFARNVDPEVVLAASRRAADLIVKVAGGSVDGATVKVGKMPRESKVVELSLEYVIDKIGFEVSASDVEDVFKRLGFIVSKKDNVFNVTVPTFRSEVDRPIDLVEEFIRIFGSDKIPSTPLICAAALRNHDPIFSYNRKSADMLSAMGLNECQHYTLKESGKIGKFRNNIQMLSLANPLTSDQDCLRPSLLESLLEALALNIDNGNKFKGLFENGRVFRVIKNELMEVSSTAFAFALSTQKPSWLKREEPDFYTAKKYVLDILALLGVDISKLNFTQNDENFWQPNFSAKCGLLEREGYNVSFGAINFAVLKEYGIDSIVFAGEVSFRSDVASRKKQIAKFEHFSLFPPAQRDIAIIVKENTPSGEVSLELGRIAKSACKGLFDLEDVDIFDSYQGKGVEEGMKSLAFSLTFRSKDRTLQTEEVNKVFENICSQLQKKYQLRVS